MADKPEINELLDAKQAFTSMQRSRGTYDDHWQECARFGSPRDSIFYTERSPGQKLRSEQFHSGAELALDTSSSYYKAFTTPDGQRWHGLQSPELGRDSKEDRVLYDEIEDILFKYRYLAEANFSASRGEAIRSHDGFGNGIIYIGRGETLDLPIRYRYCHLSQCYMTVDNYDVINGMYYHRKLTPKQIIDEYGEENVAKSIIEKANNPSMVGSHGAGATYSVVNSVTENPDYDPNSPNKLKMKYKSRHFMIGEGEEKGFLRKGGYNVFPYAVLRDTHTPDEVYGRGKLQKCLSEIKLLNQIKKTYIRAGHNATTPTLLMRDDSSINPAHLVPNGLAVGGVDSNGNPTVRPLDRGSRFEIAEHLMEEENAIIDRIFHLNTYISEIGNTRDRVTATEITARMQEQVRVIGPQASRDEAQFLGPMIERELDILDSFGLLPETGERFEFDITYRGALSLAQKSDQVIGANRTAEAVLNAAQADPSILKAMDWYEYANFVGVGNGAPAQIMLSRDEYNAAIQQEKQEAIQQSVIENAGGLASGVNTLLAGGANEPVG